jgi:hypothetical protein
MYEDIMYEAYGEKGDIIRPAKIISELPHELRKEACNRATVGISDHIGIIPDRPIYFGSPVYKAFKMDAPTAKRNPHAVLLLSLGCDVSLSFCK